MAEKKTTAVAVQAEPVKPVVLRDDKTNEVYVLEFNRDSIKFAETRKFDINALGDGGVSISAIEDLFCYSFRMHHPTITKAQTDKILYEKLGGIPDGLLERLVELYLVPFNSLVRTEESAKNATMTMEL